MAEAKRLEPHQIGTRWIELFRKRINRIFEIAPGEIYNGLFSVEFLDESGKRREMHGTSLEYDNQGNSVTLRYIDSKQGCYSRFIPLRTMRNCKKIIDISDTL